MKKLIIGGLAALAIGLGTAPTALAEPSPEPPPCLPFGIPVIQLIPNYPACTPVPIPPPPPAPEATP